MAPPTVASDGASVASVPQGFEPGTVMSGISPVQGIMPGTSPGIMLPGIMLPGTMLPGIMLPGTMLPGIMLPGTMPGIMLPGIMLPGIMLPGIIGRPGIIM
jgi:hypothetical protein